MKRARRRRQVHLRFKGKRNRRWHRAWGRKAMKSLIALAAADLDLVMKAFFSSDSSAKVAEVWNP